MFKQVDTTNTGFTRANAYPGPVPSDRTCIRERTENAYLHPPASERLLQAVWYDPALRPDGLTTADGEPLVVDSPGAWNLGPGPDFSGAVLRIGREQRRLHGDVEVHIRPSDWTAHGHVLDPRYSGVRFHVTFVPDLSPNPTLPPGTVRISLRDRLAADPSFSFDSIDPAAYPFTVRQGPCPCADVLETWTPDERERLLDAAGEERLRRKTLRFRWLAQERGTDQAFYEDLMAGLGYRHNKAPFRRLAMAVPVATLREEAGGSPQAAFALLAGVSGLLPATPKPGWDTETCDELRATWTIWWKQRPRWEQAGLTLNAWRLSGTRPANTPIRRLRAAAQWMTRPTPLPEALREAARSPATVVRTALAWLDTPPEGYWSRRLTWGGAIQPAPVALVGNARARALLSNVVVPFLSASGSSEVMSASWLDALPPESMNALIRRTAHALFGPDHSRSLVASGLRRQGLLQLFHDYCLPDRSACSACPLCAALQKTATDAPRSLPPGSAQGFLALRRLQRS